MIRAIYLHPKGWDDEQIDGSAALLRQVTGELLTPQTIQLTTGRDDFLSRGPGMKYLEWANHIGHGTHRDGHPAYHLLIVPLADGGRIGRGVADCLTRALVRGGDVDAFGRAFQHARPSSQSQRIALLWDQLYGFWRITGLRHVERDNWQTGHQLLVQRGMDT
jgi:hypothetical protein